MLVPQKLLDFAHIKENVKIIGTINTFELWDEDSHENYEFTNIPPDDEYYADVEKIAGIIRGRFL